VHFVDISLAQPKSVWGTLRFKWLQNLRMWRALHEFRPDIRIAVPTWLTAALLFGSGRMVLESHNNRTLTFADESQSWYKKLKVLIAEHVAACVIVLTHEQKTFWPHAREIKVIGNFSNIHVADCEERNNAAAVGRLAPAKQFDLLLDAWAIVAKHNAGCMLDIYGDGPERERLERQIDALGLKENVRLHGNSSDIAAAYASHEFLIMSSRNEGLPLVLIEAMQCGCPCVSVDCECGPREIISDGKDGLLVPYRGLNRKERVRNLADAICRMLDDPGRCRKMGDAARQNAAKFDKSAIMQQWQQLFRELKQ